MVCVLIGNEVWIETWQLNCGSAFNTSLLTEFLRLTEGFECLIRGAATHDSNSSFSVFHWQALPLNPNTLFFFFFLPSLSLTFRPLSPLAGLPHPSHSISLYLPPLFPHSRVSSAPSLLPDHLRWQLLSVFCLRSFFFFLFPFRTNYRRPLHISISRRDCAIGSAVNNSGGLCQIDGHMLQIQYWFY